MSRATDIADAIVGVLNAAELGFGATREWLAIGELGESDDPVVVVVPSGAEWSSLSRESRTVDTTVTIVVRRMISQGPDAPEGQIDEMVALCEQIMDLLAGVNLGGGSYVGLRQDPLWRQDVYEQHHEFVAEMEVTYRCHVP
jgi:hypothetical protein